MELVKIGPCTRVPGLVCSLPVYKCTGWLTWTWRGLHRCVSWCGWFPSRPAPARPCGPWRPGGQQHHYVLIKSHLPRIWMLAVYSHREPTHIHSSPHSRIHTRTLTQNLQYSVLFILVYKFFFYFLHWALVPGHMCSGGGRWNCISVIFIIFFYRVKCILSCMQTGLAFGR